MDAALKQWERHLSLPDSTKVYVRPIRPEDEQLYGRFFAVESTADVRLRFFGPVKAFDHAFFARFTHLDYAKAMAFIAIDETTGEMLGVVRLHASENGKSGEYGIIVRSDYKKHGLGWQLMQMIIDYARARGLSSIEGQVMADNEIMLTMCREFGFQVRWNRDEPSICDVKLEL